MSFTTLIDVASVHLLAPDSVILDCRYDLQRRDAGRQAFLLGHIPGARHADLNLNLSAPVTADSGRHPLPSPRELGRFLRSVGVGADTQVVAYDEANSSFAARAWWLLKWLGHARVAVLDGGFNAWVAGGGTIESGESAPVATPGDAHFEPTPDAYLDAADVLRALDDSRRLLVDARAAERFAGSVEPLDTVAGHIPGSVNHPFVGNLDSDGRFLPAAELRRMWLARLQGTSPGDTIALCGSGVTACHNLLALSVAGLPGAKLYAGSWSEWIRDPKRPVALGAR